MLKSTKITSRAAHASRNHTSRYLQATYQFMGFCFIVISSLTIANHANSAPAPTKKLPAVMQLLGGDPLGIDMSDNIARRSSGSKFMLVTNPFDKCKWMVSVAWHNGTREAALSQSWVEVKNPDGTHDCGQSTEEGSK